ncbi:MAG: hypothetical protein PHQ23_06670 [Candidatus Wallbacteria bacterium]|nr:hypothetical protein [Candidatus Wallbacteria bacterium]
MDQVKGAIAILVGAIILFYLSAWSDDLQYFMGLFHESLHNDPMAKSAYENVIYDYGNRIQDAKEKLAAMGDKRYIKDLEDQKRYEQYKIKISGQPVPGSN